MSDNQVKVTWRTYIAEIRTNGVVSKYSVYEIKIYVLLVSY